MVESHAGVSVTWLSSGGVTWWSQVVQSPCGVMWWSQCHDEVTWWSPVMESHGSHVVVSCGGVNVTW
jgi:hypothetical protein